MFFISHSISHAVITFNKIVKKTFCFILFCIFIYILCKYIVNVIFDHNYRCPRLRRYVILFSKTIRKEKQNSNKNLNRQQEFMLTYNKHLKVGNIPEEF